MKPTVNHQYNLCTIVFSISTINITYILVFFILLLSITWPCNSSVTLIDYKNLGDIENNTDKAFNDAHSLLSDLDFEQHKKDVSVTFSDVLLNSTYTSATNFTVLDQENNSNNGESGDGFDSTSSNNTPNYSKHCKRFTELDYNNFVLEKCISSFDTLPFSSSINIDNVESSNYSCLLEHIFRLNDIKAYDMNNNLLVFNQCDDENCYSLDFGGDNDNYLSGNCSVYYDEVTLKFDIKTIEKIVITDVLIDDYLELRYSFDNQPFKKIFEYPDLVTSPFVSSNCDNDKTVILSPNIVILDNSQSSSMSTIKNLVFRKKIIVGEKGESNVKIKVYFKDGEFIKDEFSNTTCLDNLKKLKEHSSIVNLKQSNINTTNNTRFKTNYQCLKHYEVKNGCHYINSNANTRVCRDQSFVPEKLKSYVQANLINVKNTSYSTSNEIYSDNNLIDKNDYDYYCHKAKVSLDIVRENKESNNVYSNISQATVYPKCSQVLPRYKFCKKESAFLQNLSSASNSSTQKVTNYKCYQFIPCDDALNRNSSDVQCKVIEILRDNEESIYSNHSLSSTDVSLASSTFYTCTTTCFENETCIDGCKDLVNNSNCSLQSKRCINGTDNANSITLQTFNYENDLCSSYEYTFACDGNIEGGIDDTNVNVVKVVECSNEIATNSNSSSSSNEDYVYNQKNFDSIKGCLGTNCNITEVVDNKANITKAAVYSQILNYMQTDMSCNNDNSTYGANCTVFKASDSTCREGLGNEMKCCNSGNKTNVYDYLRLASSLTALNTALNSLENKEQSFGTWRDKDLFNNGQGFISSELDSILADVTSKSVESVTNEITRKLNEKAATIISAVFGEWAKDKIYQEVVTDEGMSYLKVNPSIMNSMQNLMGYYAAYTALKEGVNIATSCHASEQETSVKISTQSCSYLRTECAHSVLGKCQIYKKHYCCYNSALARIIMEQLRLSGQIENSCRGLRIEDLGNVDLSSIDLSEWVALMEKSNLGNINEDVLNLTGKDSPITTIERKDVIERTIEKIEFSK